MSEEKFLEFHVEPISFGVTLKKIRLWKGVTQADLAHSLDISKTSISAYEKGRVPSKPTIDKMTQYFEYELKELGLDLYLSAGLYSRVQKEQLDQLEVAVDKINDLHITISDIDQFRKQTVDLLRDLKKELIEIREELAVDEETNTVPLN